MATPDHSSTEIENKGTNPILAGDDEMENIVGSIHDVLQFLVTSLKAKAEQGGSDAAEKFGLIKVLEMLIDANNRVLSHFADTGCAAPE